MRKLVSLLMIGLLYGSSLQAQLTRGHVVFATRAQDTVPYRIPAITQTRSGDIIYFTDWRPCKQDIGYGRVDQHYRVMPAGSDEWGPEHTLIAGSGVKGQLDCGFGDPCLVADRTSDEVLLLTGCGSQAYNDPATSRANPECMALFRSKDGGRTWEKWRNMTEKMYGFFDHKREGKVQSLFCASGKIFQSRVYKRNKYYRLYASLLTKPYGNFVIYSDDFGRKWHVLGGIEVEPCPRGDEAKCEELPDGSLLLSSRKGSGRWFNIFRFSDVARGEGHWGKPAASEAFNKGVAAKENSCNGEVLIVKARRSLDGQPTHVLLQSVPAGPGRSHVSIYFKELENESAYTSPSVIAADWGGKFQVTSLNSAYSTMVELHDGRIAFAWEEETFGKAYTEKFDILTLDEITKGQFSALPRTSR